MAKSKRVNAASRRGGDVIVADGAGDLGRISLRGPLGAMGNIGVSDVLPPLIGGVLALAGTLASRYLSRAYMKDFSTSVVYRHPELVGGVAAILLSVPMYWWKGSKAMMSSMISAGVISASWYGYSLLSGKVEDAASKAWVKHQTTGGTSGLGLLSVSDRPALRGINVTGGGRALPTASMPSAINGAMNVSVFGKRAY